MSSDLSIVFQKAIAGQVLAWHPLPNYRPNDPPRMTARCTIQRGDHIEHIIVKANTRSQAIANEVQAYKLLTSYTSRPFNIPSLIDFRTTPEDWSWLMIREEPIEEACMTQACYSSADTLVWLHSQQSLFDCWSAHHPDQDSLTGSRERQWMEALKSIDVQHLYVLRHAVLCALQILNTPYPDISCFVHGDYHRYNLGIVAGGESASLLIMDWEDAGIGHPWIDLAKYLSFCSAHEREVFLEKYRSAASRYHMVVPRHVLARAWAGALGEVASSIRNGFSYTFYELSLMADAVLGECN